MIKKSRHRLNVNFGKLGDSKNKGVNLKIFKVSGDLDSQRRVTGKLQVSIE